MKNKNLLLLLGAGVAYYFFYKMYAKKTTTNDVKKPLMSPVLNDLSPNANNVINVLNLPSPPYRVDNVKTAELDYTPNTYQTFYGKINGQDYKVPSTC